MAEAIPKVLKNNEIATPACGGLVMTATFSTTCITVYQRALRLAMIHKFFEKTE